jgi:hypothetical protein
MSSETKPITSYFMYDQSKRLTILTAKEIRAVYGFPQFTDEERDVYFALDPFEKQQLDKLRNITALSTSFYS